LKWDDPAIGIDWEVNEPILSYKDRETEQRLEDFSTTFLV
jgi:dTDP-4-dehydrorhamnose 3,5-epimerase-like enzyme